MMSINAYILKNIDLKIGTIDRFPPGIEIGGYDVRVRATKMAAIVGRSARQVLLKAQNGTFNQQVISYIRRQGYRLNLVLATY